METPNNATTSTNNKIPEESVICHENIKGYVEPRFECSICLSWLQDPVLTSCGHKFCSECIRNWLEKGGVCPVDNQPLKSENLFRDLYTSREISEKRTTCLYQQFGCQVELSPVDVETHIGQCTYRRNLPESQAVQNTNNAMSVESKLWDPTPKNGTQTTDKEPSPDWQLLIKNLFEKIIALQQENQELSITVSNQKNKLETMCLRNCNGVCIWRLDSFQEKLAAMINNPRKMFYGPVFYTNPNGYKICARINICPQNSDYLALILHFMKSENDDALDWPFNGTMCFILVHPEDSKKNICETMESKSNIEAFRKPTGVYNLRGYGYQEFVRVCDVSNFLQNDNFLIFRIEVYPKLHNTATT